DDQDDGYKIMGDTDSDEDGKKEMPIAVSTSFHDNLQVQLSMCILDNHEFLVAQQILGSLDDDGYLRRPLPAIVDDLAFSQNVFTTEDEIENLLGIIQEFDPAGVGARSLQECLYLQLK